MAINSLDGVFNTAASGMSAQSVRLNTIASNLANANNVGSSPESTYRSKTPVFAEITQENLGLSAGDQAIGGVEVQTIAESTKPLQKRYEPDHPLANEDGFIYVSDVNPIEQMTNMISASKAYQADVELMNSTKSLIMQTINVLNAK
jgi:flagellar basal-body rod protein FlgC